MLAMAGFEIYHHVREFHHPIGSFFYFSNLLYSTETLSDLSIEKCPAEYIPAASDWFSFLQVESHITWSNSSQANQSLTLSN